MAERFNDCINSFIICVYFVHPLVLILLEKNNIVYIIELGLPKLIDVIKRKQFLFLRKIINSRNAVINDPFMFMLSLHNQVNTASNIDFVSEVLCTLNAHIAVLLFSNWDYGCVYNLLKMYTFKFYTMYINIEYTCLCVLFSNCFYI